MTKIEKLTEAQERELVEFRLKMWAQGTSTAPCDRLVAEKAITEAYAEIGRPAPKFFWMPSPMTSALALYVLGKFADEMPPRQGDGLGDGLRDGLGDGLGDGLRAGLGDGLRDGKIDPSIGQTWWWGQMDSYWLAYYRFGTDLGVKQKPDLLRRLDIMERIAGSCGFWYPRDGICIVSDRFAATHWDEARNAVGMPTRLHCEDKPAISFRDGWGVYYWHGYRIPVSHEWIITEKSRLTPDTIDAEPNAELRRIMLEIEVDGKTGFERYIEARGAKVISEDVSHGRPRRLLEVNIKGDRRRVLDVLNGSLEPDGSRRRFFIGAMPGANTPHDAVAMSYGINPSVYSEGVRT